MYQSQAASVLNMTLCAEAYLHWSWLVGPNKNVFQQVLQSSIVLLIGSDRHSQEQGHEVVGKYRPLLSVAF